jgi:hypothetical protein
VHLFGLDVLREDGVSSSPTVNFSTEFDLYTAAPKFLVKAQIEVDKNCHDSAN